MEENINSKLQLRRNIYIVYAVDIDILFLCYIEITLGTLLRETITGALFRSWAVICSRHFPTPPYWKTFRELCATWRHHEVLIREWDKINVALLTKLLPIMFGNDFPGLNGWFFYQKKKINNS